MDFLQILQEGLLGSFSIIKNLVKIIVPLMVFIQLLTDYKLMEKLSMKTKFLTDFLGVSKDTLIALLIGVFAGISYGAGAIFDAKRTYNLSKKDVFLVMVFLVPFHGVIEITLVFWLLGVNPVLLIFARLAVAIPATLFFKRLLEKKGNFMHLGE